MAEPARRARAARRRPPPPPLTGSPASPRARARVARQRAARVRRARVTLAASVVVSVLMLAIWFPASTLLRQHRSLAATNAQLAALRQQDQALSKEQRLLRDPAEIERIARQQYQLVSPGQRAYEVLPPTGDSRASDPGNQSLVSPSAANELAPSLSGGSSSTASHGSGSTGAPSAAASTTSPGGGSSGSGTSAHGAASGHAASPGFVGRIVQTLEFWR